MNCWDVKGRLNYKTLMWKNKWFFPGVFINTVNTSNDTDKQASSIMFVCKNKLLNTQKNIRAIVQNENWINHNSSLSFSYDHVFLVGHVFLSENGLAHF